MLSHITVGTNHLARAESFYDDIFVHIKGTEKYLKTNNEVIWSFKDSFAKFSLTKPLDGAPASVGNGAMMAFIAETPEHINRVHHSALSLGAACEGLPGARYGGKYYAAYVRDLDGNKLAFFHILDDDLHGQNPNLTA